jgi:hypothetical protein
LHCVLNLLKEVPAELLILPPADYARLVLAKSTIEETVAVWRSRGNVGDMAHLKGSDAATVIRRALVKCPVGVTDVAGTDEKERLSLARHKCPVFLYLSK